MTLKEAATVLKVDYQKARRLIQEGRLPAHQLCPGAPWIISTTDVDRLRAGERTGNAPVWHCSKTMTQQTTGLDEPCEARNRPASMAGTQLRSQIRGLDRSHRLVRAPKKRTLSR